AARHEQPRAVEAAHVLADDGADIAGNVGIDRGFEDRRDHRALSDGGLRIERAAGGGGAAADTADAAGEVGRRTGRRAGFAGSGRGSDGDRENRGRQRAGVEHHRRRGIGIADRGGSDRRRSGKDGGRRGNGRWSDGGLGGGWLLGRRRSERGGGEV